MNAISDTSADVSTFTVICRIAAMLGLGALAITVRDQTASAIYLAAFVFYGRGW